jgi:uncharacterized membrane protein YgdD (TMEM256/DUF423 family)
MTKPSWLRVIGISGALAVLAGAFGAHGLTGKAAEWARTGSSYQLLHLAVALALLLTLENKPAARLPILLFLVGGWIFAGTLYAMALGAPRWLGAVTPIGGVTLVIGWLVLARRAPQL